MTAVGAWAPLETTLNALRLIVDDVARVDPLWLVAGVALFQLQQAVRTRGWWRILRAAYPDAVGLRARDVCWAYLAGAGLNAVLPARMGDVLKLWLVRRRAPQSRWSTLAATFLPETLFDVVVGAALVAWALSAGLLPLPSSATELPTFDVSVAVRHPFLTPLVIAGVAVTLWWLRRRVPDLFRRLRQGFAILGTPRTYLTGVVTWQALARAIRLLAIVAWMRAFALPVTAASVLLVMAAQGGGRIIPIAPVSAGLRLVLLSYGLTEVTGQVVDIAAITAFQVGVGTATLLGSLLVGAVALALALESGSPRGALQAVRHARAEGRRASSDRTPAP